jgi:hypothetical protein
MMKFTESVDVSLFAREYQQAPPPSEPVCVCGHPASWHGETPKGAQKAYGLGPTYCNPGRHLRDDCDCRTYEERR